MSDLAELAGDGCNGGFGSLASTSVSVDGCGSSPPLLAGTAVDLSIESAVNGHSSCQFQNTTSVNDVPYFVRKKRGKPCRNGPDFRLAPAEESAVSRAIRTAAQREGQPIFAPYEGLTFNSKEEAKDFYNLYSWEIGFGVRFGRDRINDAKYTTRQDIVCSCEGFNRSKNSASIRTGCTAKIRLLRTKDHGWYISSIDDNHNHRFSESFGHNKQWNSHGEIDSITKDFIRRMRENNVSVGRICNILGISDCNHSSAFRREAVRSICSKVAQEELKDDIGKTMKLLEEMKSLDPMFQVRFELDSERRIRSMLWCSGKNIMDYALFGDAITFDTTYRTNLYSLPFGLFMGVNNHFQSVVFGGVLLTTEKTADFEWAFKSFVDIMGGQAPKTILTDQCGAMAKAIRNLFTDTRHRWCRWHVLKSAKERLGNVYSKHKKFKDEFHDLITDEVEIERFESGWDILMKRYRLVKNKFLKRLFKYREKWAKPYFMDIFCAGMTSTQRSESGNHMLKRYIQRAAPMHLFVRKFNELQSDRNDQVSKEEHCTNQVSRKLRFGVPIESHANELYTRAMYEKFCDELYESGSFVIGKVRDDGTYVVVETKFDGNKVAKEFIVSYDRPKKVSCLCGLFEHLGMICRHSIKVLLHLDEAQIPQYNILARWTKAGVDGGGADKFVFSGHGRGSHLARKMLVSKVCEIAHKDGNLDESSIVEVLKILDGAHLAGEEQPSGSDSHSSGLIGSGAETPLDCPVRTITGGRRPCTGLKAWQSSCKKARAKKRDDSSVIADWPEEEIAPNRKRKTIAEIMLK